MTVGVAALAALAAPPGVMYELLPQVEYRRSHFGSRRAERRYYYPGRHDI